MNRIQSRNPKTNKNIERLKKDHIKIISSIPNKRIAFNDTMLLKVASPTRRPKEENCFVNRNIFAQRSYKRIVSSTNQSNREIQQRREAFFIPVCSVRDMQSPLKADIIKYAYNTPLNRIKSQKSQFPVSYQNIKFNLPRRQNYSDKDQKLFHNHLLEFIRKEPSSKKQLNSQEQRSKTSYSRNCVTEQRQHHKKVPSKNIRKVIIADFTTQKSQSQNVNMKDSLLSLSKEEVVLSRINSIQVLSPWQFDN